MKTAASPMRVSIHSVSPNMILSRGLLNIMSCESLVLWISNQRARLKENAHLISRGLRGNLTRVESRKNWSKAKREVSAEACKAN